MANDLKKKRHPSPKVHARRVKRAGRRKHPGKPNSKRAL